MKLKYLVRMMIFFTQKIEKIWNEGGEEIEVAPHAKKLSE
jgi:hypothetical protein